MDRRTFLGAGLGLTSLLFPRTSRAFGEIPLGGPSLDRVRVDGVLELFLCGGVSQYESFYAVPEHGAADGTHWHLFADSPELDAMLDRCGLGGPLLEPFAVDELGQTVHFGPFALPLRARPDVLDRTRLTVLRHALAPHEAAIPLALSGRTLGNPALAGMGAHVERHFRERAPNESAPSAYLLLSSSLSPVPIDNLRSAAATGAHPGSARPLTVKVDASGDFSALLSRASPGAQRAEYDRLLKRYLDAYEDRLSVGSEIVRAPRFRELAAGARAVAGVSAVESVFEAGYFQRTGGRSCESDVAVDGIGMQLRLAAHLLTHPVNPARWVTVIDGGFVPTPNGGGGYDSHANNIEIQARNLSHTLRTLMGLIARPGEKAPGKIDLDRTLIVLNTEFGRTPWAQANSGRNHWPYGYPIVSIGGPIQRRGIAGAIGPDGGGTKSVSPAEGRIATLLALGIWPFSAEAFSIADVAGATSPNGAIETVLARHLGVA